MFETLYADPTYQELANTRVDVPSVDGWKDIPIKPINEPTVAIDDPTLPFFSGRIYGDGTYYGKLNSSPYKIGELKGALITPFTSLSIARALHKAAETLPPGVILIARDLLRSVELQQALYDFYYLKLEVLHPIWSSDELSKETQKFVSLPSTDTTKPSPHNTRGALDVDFAYLEPTEFNRLNRVTKTMKELYAKHGDTENWDIVQRLFIMQREIDAISRSAHSLPFGAPFDWGSHEAGWDYLESRTDLSPDELRAQGNRRFLGNFMIEIEVLGQKIQLYEHEYWHFNVLNQMAAASAGQDVALLGSTELSWQNQVYELIMKQVHTGMINDHIKGAGRRGLNKMGLDSVNKMVLLAVNKSTELFGDPRRANISRAEIIAPVA